ncbi:LexA family transcriptional regulator [Anaerococcus sp. Marseille-P3625]|uniref:LexA family protein n=1 Tax=Anaerococcus sp. Marseille-P3625 TaxID=1977277 RepID=UPI000C071D37|nr:LexA family transcriptional regulator [Anaerococcus sp. Marseille-P3625]
MATLNQNIKKRRIELNMTQEELALKTGYKSKSAISKIELGNRDLSQSQISVFAKALNTTPGYLMGWKDDPDYSKIPGIKIIKKFVNVPILGEIACGQPMFCEENFEGIFQIDEDLDQPDFCLIARGDSMIDAGIHDGDIAFMRKTPIVENGKIAAVYYDEDVTLKRYYSKGNQVILQPENKFYSPIIIDLYEDIPLQILGELIGVYSKVSR